MNFNEIKIDKPRSIITCFNYFKENMLDFHTVVTSGGFATLSDISYGFFKRNDSQLDSIPYLYIKKNSSN